MALVKDVLLFGTEMWVVTPQMEKSPEGPHHRLVHQMVDMGPKSQQDGTCMYTPVGVALEMAGLEYIGVFISRLHVQYIVTRTIMDLCLAAEQSPGLRLLMRWWEQPPLDILVIRAGHATSKDGGGRR